MTKEEAIKILKYNKPISDPRLCGIELCDACDIAIEALEKQSHTCSNCKYFNKDWTYTCTEVHLCTKHNIARYENAFCSDWENKDD